MTFFSLPGSGNPLLSASFFCFYLLPSSTPSPAPYNTPLLDESFLFGIKRLSLLFPGFCFQTLFSFLLFGEKAGKSLFVFYTMILSLWLCFEKDFFPFC